MSKLVSAIITRAPDGIEIVGRWVMKSEADRDRVRYKPTDQPCPMCSGPMVIPSPQPFGRVFESKGEKRGDRQGVAEPMPKGYVAVRCFACDVTFSQPKALRSASARTEG